MQGKYYNKSYFIGVDSEFGRGNATYFSFFSEFNRTLSGTAYIEAIVLILLFIFSSLGNGTVFVHILNLKSTRTVTNYLICNLAFADLCFTCGAPLIAVTRISGIWVLGTFVCKLLVYLLFVCGSVMIWTMAIISIDRYICIIKISSRNITPRTVIAILVGIWITILLSFIPLYTYFTVKSFTFGSSDIQVCTLMWPYSTKIRISLVFTVPLCLSGFAIPLIILLHNYVKILQRFCTSSRSMFHANERVGTTSIQQRRYRSQRDFKVTKTLILVVVIFLIMWAPIFIVFILLQANGLSSGMEVPSHSLIVALCVAVCNACVNPFLYGIMNEKLKHKITTCFLCKKRKSTEKEMNTT